ncbi:hemolysin family protein [Paenibacillus sp. FSL W7-1287]|uniref:hemolysin family protein n=1 Tax=Paenibacillus sp. FSL W7-1287 TaxID=2954538 RepID=UPI0030F8EB64
MLSIVILLTMYSAYFCIIPNIQAVTNGHRMLQWLKKHEQIILIFPALCLCVLGMCVFRLSHEVHKLLVSNELHYSEGAILTALIVIIVISLWLEVRYRYRWQEWLLRLLQLDSSTVRKSIKTEQEHLMISKELEEFQEKLAREVMTPRIDMICLEQHLSFEQNINTAIQHMRTRYPVVNEDKDDVIGFMHIKDLLAIYDEANSRAQWKRWIRPIITVPESIEISQLLTMMQAQKTQIALLIDEFGGTSGMVTMEDIIEEIVGDIQDEFDEEELQITKLKTDEYRLSAMLLIEEVNSFFNIHLEADDMDSIGGYMYANILFPPHIGQSVVYEQGEHQFIFTITGMEQLRITTVGVKRCNKELRMSSPQL